MNEGRELVTLGLLVSLLAGCAPRPKPAGALDLETTQVGAETRLTLLPAPGLRLNARLKPALELSDGRVLRFDSPHLTPDSAYFAEPPSVLAPGIHSQLHGKLRASVCDVGETLCRSIVIDL